jgi:hypothetical protein
MSSYAKYCRDQAAECARRARLARSPEIAENCRSLEQRWLRLAARSEDRSGPLSIPIKRALATSARI